MPTAIFSPGGQSIHDYVAAAFETEDAALITKDLASRPGSNMSSLLARSV